MRSFPGRILLMLAVLVPASSVTAQGPPAADLAARAQKFIKTHCHQCHSGEGSDGGNFDLLNRKHLLATDADWKTLVVPGKLEGSRTWFRTGDRKTMPPKAVKERPTEAEIEILKAWITAGAPAFPEEVIARKTITPAEEIQTILADLRKVEPEDQPYRRYFTLNPLHNDPTVPDANLRLARGALSRAINSLTWKARIAVPQAINEAQTVFAIDLRDYDWDRIGAWPRLESAYPYGLKPTLATNPDLVAAEKELTSVTKTEQPVLRADWFVSMATRPPLYHYLLQIPQTLPELERRLDVDVLANFQRDRLMRAGFIKSGVSEQNRLIERHDGLFGAYWKSYDFKPKGEKGDLLRFPLGPVSLTGPRYADIAFVHDGGEMIFHLPNGLQGYMLVDGKDRRIDAGPLDVVGDRQKTSGSSEIVNGLSCMACHQWGPVVPPKDSIRAGLTLEGAFKRKVERIFPTDDRLAKFVQEDSQRFLQAAEKATAVYLRVGADKERPVSELPEPVGETARAYIQDVRLTTAAAELGITAERLKNAIELNPRMREIGLGPLAQGGVLKRSDWQSEGQAGFSMMQRAARELNLGVPFRN